jgi:hypothetical protein
MSEYFEGFKDMLNISEDYYNKYYLETKNEKYKKILDIINIEVKRTLTEEFINSNQIFASNLEEILKVFVISNNQKYFSGMSFIANMVLKLANNDKIKAFIVLKNIFEDKNIKDIYENNTDNIVGKFKIKFKEKMPLLFQHFEKNNIQPYSILTWFKSLFAYDFEESIAEYIFKSFIIKNNFDIYIYAVLSVFKIYENELLNKNNNELLSFFFSMSKGVDLNKFRENFDKYIEI